MQAIMTDAYQNPSDGRVKVVLSTSTNTGYVNNCEQYNDYGHYSVPLPNQIVNVDAQALSQVLVTGYNNTITDTNFSVNPGESANYSSSWYHVRSNAGIYLQPANTAHKENAMMGQSTNGVLTDIMSLLVDIINYLSTHTHGGVQSGAAISGAPTQAVPDDSNVVADQSYISANHNLAITGTYQPK